MTIRRLSLFLPAFLLMACGGSVAVPGSKARDDIDELQKRVIELQRRAAVSEIELRELQDEVARLGKTRSVAEATVSARPSEQARDVGWEPPVQTVEIETTDLPPAAAPIRASDTASREPARLPPPSVEAQALYDRGYTLYHQGRYEDAERIFRELLSTHGESELSDNAWYWIGESRWARGDVTGSLDAFRETLENYPGGNKTPDALLKMGQSLERLNDAEGARDTYHELIRRYPATAAAAVAQDRLAGTD